MQTEIISSEVENNNRKRDSDKVDQRFSPPILCRMTFMRYMIGSILVSNSFRDIEHGRTEPASTTSIALVISQRRSPWVTDTCENKGKELDSTGVTAAFEEGEVVDPAYVCASIGGAF